MDLDDEDDVKPTVDEPSCVLLGPGPSPVRRLADLAVHRKFIARPDVDRLLADMTALRERERAAERKAAVKQEEELENWQEFDATAHAGPARSNSKSSSARPKPKPKPKPKAKA